MTSAKPSAINRFPFERVLAALAAAICVIVTVWVWIAVSSQQPMWPLPALYLIEVVAASVAGMLGIFRGDDLGSGLAWAMIGLLAGFAALGALSVGIFYQPVVLLLALAALWLERQAWRRLPLHLLTLVVAAVAEGVFMLAVIPILSRGAGF